MLIGYKSINNILDQKCKVDYIKFKSNLQDSFDSNSYYGYFKDSSINAPCEYDQICFLNKTIPNIDDVYTNGDNLAYKAIRQAYEAGDDTNVYLVKDSFSESLMNYEDLLVYNSGTGFVCIPVKGSKFNIRIEGVSRGNIKVSDPITNEPKAVNLN